MANHAALIATIALVSLSSAAFAQDSDHAQRGACRDDVQKLCAGVERGQIRDCLAGQKDKLSDACKARVESRGK
ncbi:hypothetical protein [Bradyrhizobium sp. LTSPM299]|jgi:hypothetical protein|uniref:hypothetical protein n=1 Tax=Bradyrhizobium sp. LTSPM299 TaxID=1619233 RepID=UPI0009E3BEEB|nr:hypothetical protein [Bradyrhizobium sp. LTSPM299]